VLCKISAEVSIREKKEGVTFGNKETAVSSHYSVSDWSDATTIIIIKCKTLGFETTENWYSHISKPVCQHENITVLWNQGTQTDRFWQIGSK
jgi:hypothetical protein